MLSRREFVAILAALPVARLPGVTRARCRHHWELFKQHNVDGPIREWVRGRQCQDCGHIRVHERVFIRWGGLT